MNILEISVGNTLEVFSFFLKYSFFLNLFLWKKILGLFEVFDKCMKMMMNVRREEDE